MQMLEEVSLDALDDISGGRAFDQQVLSGIGGQQKANLEDRNQRLNMAMKVYEMQVNSYERQQDRAQQWNMKMFDTMNQAMNQGGGGAGNMFGGMV